MNSDLTAIEQDITDLSDNRIKNIEDAAEIANAITALQLLYEAGKWVSGKIKNGGWFGNKLNNDQPLLSNGVNPFTSDSFEKIVSQKIWLIHIDMII